MHQLCRATRVGNVSYHLAVGASAALLEPELSEQSSSIGHGRFFPDMLKGSLHTRLTNISRIAVAQLGSAEPRASCALIGRMCLSFICAVRFFTVWSGSDTIGQRVRSSAAASPLHGPGV